MKWIQSLVILLFSFFSSMVFATGYQLVYSSTISQLGEQAKGKRPTDRGLTEIILMPKKFSVRNNYVERIFDFDTRRLIYIDHATKTFRQYSLYAEVAFRTAELRNRTEILAKLKNANQKRLKDDVLDQFKLESAFDMRAEQSIPKTIQEKVEGDKHIFSFHDNEIVSVSFEDRPIPQKLRDTFKKYLVYKHHIHPQIRNKIIDYGKVPKEINYQYLPRSVDNCSGPLS